MRRVLGLLLVLVFANFVLASSVLAATPKEQVVTQKIEYALPYPGLLPDSPVYFLKVARDRVVSFLITSKVKKAFYSLLLADKRLAAGEVLVNTGKTGLGVTTIVNGEEYFSEAVGQAEAAVKDKQDASEVVAKLTVASTKHEEMLNELMPKVSGQDASRLARAYESNQKSRNRVIGLLSGLKK